MKILKIENSAKLKKDRTTAQRAVQKLVKEGLVSRRQVNISSGGFRFYYLARPKEEIKQKMYENFCHWHSLVEEELKKW